MNDTPKSRRLAGRLMLGAAVVALPLTASISYAASELPEPPAPPAPTALSVTPPAPPAAPLPPAAPAPLTQVETIVEVDPDVEVEVSGDERRSVNRWVVRTDDGEGRVRERRWSTRGRGDMSEEEMEEIMEEVQAALEEARAELDQMPHVIEEALALAHEERGEHANRVKVEMTCDGTEGEVSSSFEREDGTQVVKICRTEMMAHALEGLKAARAELAADRELSSEMRQRVTRELDREIERWERSSR